MASPHFVAELTASHSPARRRIKEILLLLAKGHSNKMIADNLEISVDTVCHHLKHVFEKMHVSSRTEAVVRYMASKTPAAS